MLNFSFRPASRFIFTAIIATILFIANCAFAGQVKVTMLDVGQAESFLIETDAETILIDTADAAYRNSLMNQLAEIDTIDYLILTHPHADHIANAEYLLKNKTVATVYDNGKNSGSKYYINYLSQTRKQGIPRRTLREGDILFLDDGAYLEVLNSYRHSKNQNNDSVVCRLVYGNFSMIFTGDIEAEVEDELFHNSNNLTANILKAAHHGSKTSNTIDFLKAVNPQYVFISAGLNNKFGHPHSQSLENFILAGVPKENIFCTAYNGKVTVVTDGETFTVTPQRQADWFNNHIGYALTVTDIWSAN